MITKQTYKAHPTGNGSYELLNIVSNSYSPIIPTITLTKALAGVE